MLWICTLMERTVGRLADLVDMPKVVGALPSAESGMQVRKHAGRRESCQEGKVHNSGVA